MSDRIFLRECTRATGEIPCGSSSRRGLTARELAGVGVSLENIAAQTGYSTAANCPRPSVGHSA